MPLLLQPSTVVFQQGDGVPAHSAASGAVYLNRATGLLYQNVSGVTWAALAGVALGTTLAAYGITDAQGLNAKLTTYVGTKLYRALLTQGGTAAPVATVLENTLGGTVVWTRASLGTYTATLAGAFLANKVLFSPCPSDASIFMGVVRATDNTFTLTTRSAVDLADDQLAGASLSVTVYP